MAYKIKKKQAKNKGAMGVVDEVYDMGEDIVQRANPFSMSGRSLGYSDEAQENVRKGKHKVLSPHLKMLGQKDIPMKKEKKQKMKGKIAVMLLMSVFLLSFSSALQTCEKTSSLSCFDDVTENSVIATSKWVLDYSTDEDFFLWIDDPKTRRTEVCLLNNTATGLNELDQHKNLYDRDGELIIQLNRHRVRSSESGFDRDYYGFCRMIANDDVDYIKFGNHSTVVTYEDDTLEVIDINGTVLQDITLTENTDQCLVNCYARGHSVLYEDGILFEDFDFVDINGDLVDLSSGQISLKVEQEENVSIPYYAQTCTDFLGVDNATYEVCEYDLSCSNVTVENETFEVCSRVLEGYNYEIIDTSYYEPYDLSILSAGAYDWQISANKEAETEIDWAVSFQGFDTDTIRQYWAWWNSDWEYKKTISNLTGNITGLYSIDKEVGMNTAFTDVRFLDSATNSIELNYSIARYKNGSGLAFENLNTTGLVSYYKLDEVSGAVLDSYGSNDGTNFGATTSIGGIINTAYDFENSNNDYIDLGTGVGFTNEDMTLNTWVYLEDNGANYQTFIGGQLYGYALYMYHNDGDKLGFGKGGVGEIRATTGGHIPYNEWSMITVTYDQVANEVSFYYNGIADLNNPYNYSDEFNSGINYYLGRGSSTTIMHEGGLDEVAFWSRVLDSQEIIKNYNAQAVDFRVNTLGFSSIDMFYGNDLVTASTQSASKTYFEPVSAYYFDDGFTDYVSGYHATNVGTTHTTGYVDGGFDFAGGSAKMTLDIPANTIGTGEFTLAGWIYPRDTGENPLITTYAGTSTDMVFRIVGGSTIDFNLGVNGGSCPLNTWCHIVATRDSSNDLTLYLDGQVIDTGNSVANVDPNGNWELGFRKGNPTNQYLNGIVDEVLVYDKALTSDQVEALYTFGTSSFVLEDEEIEVIEIPTISQNNGVDLYGIMESSGAGLGIFMTMLAIAFPILLFGFMIVGLVFAVGYAFATLLTKSNLFNHK